MVDRWMKNDQPTQVNNTADVHVWDKSHNRRSTTFNRRQLPARPPSQRWRQKILSFTLSALICCRQQKQQEKSAEF